MSEDAAVQAASQTLDVACALVRRKDGSAIPMVVIVAPAPSFTMTLEQSTLLRERLALAETTARAKAAAAEEAPELSAAIPMGSA